MPRNAEIAAAFGAVALQGPFLGLLTRLPAAGQAGLDCACLLLAGGVALALRGTPPDGVLHRQLSTAVLGALGMLIGGYADAGFRPLVGGAGTVCGSPGLLAGIGLAGSMNWMQTGMLAGCLASHLAEGSASWRSGRAGVRLIACSFGMLAGMALTGPAAGALRLAGPAALCARHGAMAAGMSVGSLAAEGLASRVLQCFQLAFPRPQYPRLHEPAA